VHVREDRRNSAGFVFAGRFGFPGRVKVFDKNLVHSIIGGENLDYGSAEFSVNLVSTRGHGSLHLEPYKYFRGAGGSADDENRGADTIRPSQFLWTYCLLPSPLLRPSSSGVDGVTFMMKYPLP
jgi:hypothetical protein